jgi:hypothetical protein
VVDILESRHLTRLDPEDKTNTTLNIDLPVLIQTTPTKKNELSEREDTESPRFQSTDMHVMGKSTKDEISLDPQEVYPPGKKFFSDSFMDMPNIVEIQSDRPVSNFIKFAKSPEKNGFELRYSDGHYIKGESDLAGAIHGNVHIVNKDGSSFEGRWNKNKAEGFGNYSSNGGTNYNGNWSNNLPNGKGTLKLKDESEYCGQIHYGKKEGKGTMRWKDGAKYIGEWNNDKMQGFVRIFFGVGVKIPGGLLLARWREI